MSTVHTPELFRRFPELREKLPWAPLAQATPVHPLGRLRSYLHGPPIWIKRDDLTSGIYGGSKARALEFTFGEVLRRGARSVLSFGSVGGNSSLAVAAFAQHFRLRAILALVGRSSTEHVQRTLQLEHDLGAELHRMDAGPKALWRLARGILNAGVEKGDPRFPYVIWPRRAALFSALGVVNGAYELRRQINCGILPNPKRIYVPVGSGATLAGLMLGCELAGVRTELVGVVAPGRRAWSPRALARRAARHLQQRTREFPSVRLRNPNVEYRREYNSSSHSAAPQHAQRLLRDLENLDLDATYTARAMAALVEDLRAGKVGGPVLFWHTHSANFFDRQPQSTAEALPREFRAFFVAR